MFSYTEEQARTILATELSKALASSPFPGTTVWGDNITRPTLDGVDQVLEFHIELRNDKQVTINPNPDVRTFGRILLIFAQKQGQGDTFSLRMREHFRSYFQARQFEDVRTLIPTKLDAGPPQEGWAFKRLEIPFRFDAKNQRSP